MYIKQSRLNAPFFPVLEWSGPFEIRLHIKYQPFEILPLKSPDFKCFWILNGWSSDPHFCQILELVTKKYLVLSFKGSQPPGLEEGPGGPEVSF